jgi:nicotinamide mononucleotide transporter
MKLFEDWNLFEKILLLFSILIIGISGFIFNSDLLTIVSFNNKFYGEFLIYTLLMFPMYILGIISWIKHQSKETNSVEVNTIDKKEWGFAILISIFIFIGIYFFVKSF